MSEFLSALTIFLAAHLVPAVPPVRRRLVAGLGERRYLIAYSTVSVLLLAWVIIALLRAPYVHLWVPPVAAHWAAVVLMPFSFIFLAAGLWEPNSLSVTLATRPFDPQRPGIVGVTRHPVLWGFGLWAAAHAAVNGALAPFILFGGMTAFAFGGMMMVDKKRKKSLGTKEWHRLAARTSILPFAAGRGMGAVLTRRTLAGAVVGLGTYFLFLFWAHRALFAYDPLGMILR